MPLRRADLQTVIVKNQISPGIYTADERPLFEASGQSVSARLLPLNESVERTVYGERASTMLAMFCQSELSFCEGMGVCVNGADGACDYRVAAPPERWRSHVRLVLQKL